MQRPIKLTANIKKIYIYSAMVPLSGICVDEHIKVSGFGVLLGTAMQAHYFSMCILPHSTRNLSCVVYILHTTHSVVCKDTLCSCGEAVLCDQ